jgi:hypothetical protein
MKLILLAFFSAALMHVTAQNFIQTQYNKFFPSNKSLKLEMLRKQNDSLLLVNDSLVQSQLQAIERINALKTEVVHLKTQKFNEQEQAKTTTVSFSQKIQELRDSIALLSYPNVNCTEELIAVKGKLDPTIIHTCLWRKYKIIETGKADYKGRYDWETAIYDLTQDSTKAIKTEDLFIPEKISELENKINSRLEEDFNSMKTTDPTCFKRTAKYQPVKLQDLRITLNSNSEISFEINFGLSANCYAVNLTATYFKIMELKEFFTN